CPSGVAPPWLPMAGMTKGLAPRAFRWSTVARTIAAILAIPRLPPPTATRSPGLIGREMADNAWRTAAGISSTRGRGKDWRTRTIRGKAMAPSIYPEARTKSTPLARLTIYGILHMIVTPPWTIEFYESGE